MMPMTNPARERAKPPFKFPPLRNPGQHLDGEIQRAVDSYLYPVLFVVAIAWAVTIIEWMSARLNLPRMPLLYASVATAGSIYAAYRFFHIRARVRSLKLGRDGEKVVGQLLEELRAQGAKVFHDIPGDGFNLDHVVVCRQGIFVVETKTRSKTSGNPQISVNGQRLFAGNHPVTPDPIQQVRAQVAWLIRTLEATTGRPMFVKGALAFPGWFVQPQVTSAFRDLWVLEPKALVKFIINEPERLSQADIALATDRLARHVRQAPQ